MTETQLARFRSKYEVMDQSCCWVWNASRMANGYGQLTLARKHVLAHRVSYEHFVGPIPDGKQIDHLCRNRACVNPIHLEAVTALINQRRGIAGEKTRLRNIQTWATQRDVALERVLAGATRNSGSTRSEEVKAKMRAAWVLRKARG